MKLHNLKDIKSITKKKRNLLTCVDDGSYIFETRKHLAAGSKIIKEEIAKWGLMMHAGSVDKNLKLRFCTFHVMK